MEIRDFWCLTNLFLTETWTPSSTRTLPPTYSSQFIRSGSSLCDLWLFDLPYDFSLRSLVVLSAISPFSFVSAISGCSLCDLWFFSLQSLVLLSAISGCSLCDLSVLFRLCDLWLFSLRSLVLLSAISGSSLFVSLFLSSSSQF
ncbi:hypothetical protein Scep_009606 [Stephania cephalantha]|uniref:Uncharacterized protein n=1 Tax=Stephania cephalantha TaxID=152367 RepID=A0AAP0JUI3_9MAGN